MILTEELRLKFNVPESAIFDGSVDLIDINENLSVKKQIAYTISLLDIDYIADKNLEKIADKLSEPIDIFNPNIVSESELISVLGNDKSDKLFSGLNKIRENGLPLETLIRFVGWKIPNLGDTTSKEYAKYLSNDQNYDFKGLEKRVITELDEIKDIIFSTQYNLSTYGYVIKFPEIKEKSSESVSYVMTGSPKNFGYSTKAEFTKTLPDSWTEAKTLNADVNILITDDLNSSSSKMKKAEKLGIKIVCYDNVMN